MSVEEGKWKEGFTLSGEMKGRRWMKRKERLTLRGRMRGELMAWRDGERRRGEGGGRGHERKRETKGME